ncbi:hypothetical protein GCM10008098_26900 [Rhodanobacter panaciterrae]|uniref:DUF748 domain-containing protein n=1 Tax=Rhodanobacter panaciterrae TaxID=490572 RepID=A0ABQ3A473_9GAMM|nr:DUF748 domain-containing protein [Rhodanobacter panaciterrae]GGY32115.1 hypothetical protein GCM10008098_26900 [Rhodanobacter panaciterrae]
MKPHHRRHLGRLLVVILLLVIARALLPYAVRHYLNVRMDRMGDYHGQIADIDLHLWRGAYTINELRIVKTTGTLPAPLLDTRRADIELSWFALSHGVFRGKVSFSAPTINFVKGHGDSDSQTGKGVDWRAQLKLLAPMRLDEINVSDGTVTFQSFVLNPRVDLKMTDVNGTLTNLTNIQRRHGNRVAELHATATVLGDAPFETQASFDPLNHFGDFSYQLHASNIQLVKANDLARAYAGLDFAGGSGDFTMELEARNGQLDGYAKPIFHDLKIFSWKQDVVQDKKGPVKLAYEALAQGVVSLFESHATEQFATRVPISGRIDDKQLDTSQAILGVLHNAFVKAYIPHLKELKPADETTTH